LSVSGDANDRLTYRLKGIRDFFSSPDQYADPQAPGPEPPEERAPPA
jgi:hypothetical protein